MYVRKGIILNELTISQVFVAIGAVVIGIYALNLYVCFRTT